LTCIAVLGLGGLGSAQQPEPGALPVPIVLNDDGGWCWFQDERALVDGKRLIFGSIAAGVRDATRKGDVEVTAFDLATGETSRFELHDRLELDDHDAPALVVLPDGRYLAVYSRHGSDRLVRSRVTTRPGDAARGRPSARTR
jgi:hypothetical protein